MDTDGLQQLDLHGQTLRDRIDYWGDQLRPKEDDHLQIVFQNINRFPRYPNDVKNESLREFIKGTQADIMGMAEMGIFWPWIPTQERLWERTRGWFESQKTIAAYNKCEEKPPITQWGGTSLWSINKAAHHAFESGIDTYGLGHWAWT